MSYNHQSMSNNNNNNNNNGTGGVSSALNQDVMTNNDFPIDFDSFNSNFLKTTTNSNNVDNNNEVLPYFSSDNASSLAFLANDLIDEVNKTKFDFDLNSKDYASLSKSNGKEDDGDGDDNNEEDVVHSTTNLEISPETSSKKANTLKKTKTTAKKSKEPSLKRKRKDESKEENETKNETKKKSKSQYQRRNIK